MNLITAPYRPSRQVKTLPTIPENESVEIKIRNSWGFSQENQSPSMRGHCMSNHLVRVKAYDNLSTLVNNLQN